MFKLCRVISAILFGLMIASFSSGCSTGVEPSPFPGTLKITLQSNPNDTLIVILKDTLVVGEEDYFGNVIFQGRVFSGDYYAFLFPEKANPTQEDKTYNILGRDENGYIQYTIFESYVPPGDYDRIEFGITGDLVKLGYFEIPVKMPTGESPKQDLEHAFRIEENTATEVTVQISPFQSVTRYRDSYLFRPVLEIKDIKYIK